MKKLVSIFLFFISFTSFSQSINLILLVNGKLIISGLANTYIKFGTNENSKKYYVNYEPGNLILNEEIWLNINKEPNQKFFLHIDYYTYKKGKQELANFDVELSKYLIEHSYLIVDIYDFRNKKYKRRFKYLTDKNYLIQFYYRPENGVHGIYAPKNSVIPNN